MGRGLLVLFKSLLLLRAVVGRLVPQEGGFAGDWKLISQAVHEIIRLNYHRRARLCGAHSGSGVEWRSASSIYSLARSPCMTPACLRLHLRVGSFLEVVLASQRRRSAGNCPGTGMDWRRWQPLARGGHVQTELSRDGINSLAAA